MATEQSEDDPRFLDFSSSPGSRVTPVELIFYLVHSTSTLRDFEGHEHGSYIRIRSNSEESDDSTVPCTAKLSWRGFRASFTCLYDVASSRFVNFQIDRDTVTGATDKIIGVSIFFEIKDRDGEITKGNVKDDNGNPIIFAALDFSANGEWQHSGVAYGIQGLPGETWWDVPLSGKEMKRLGIDETNPGKTLDDEGEIDKEMGEN